MCIRLFFAILVMCQCFNLLGNEVQEDDEIIPVGTVFYGDYYALGDLVEVAGTIKGNAYLMGTQVSISGKVEGNVYAIAGSLDVTGLVQGDLLVIAGGAAIGGELTQDVTVFAANAHFNQSGIIERNVTVFAGNAELEDTIKGSVTALASNLKISGTIQQNLRAFVGQLRIFSKADIKGDVSYRSNESAWIDPEAKIRGGIIYRHSWFQDIMDMPMIRGLIIGSKVLPFLMNFLYTFAVGMILIRLFPHKLSKALTSMKTMPFKALLYGAVLLVLFPIASLVLLATVVGAPFALTLVALNILTIYSAKVFTILWGANLLFTKWKWKRNGVATLLSGQVIYSMLVAIPIVGSVLAFFAMVFGLGAIAVSQKH